MTVSEIKVKLDGLGIKYPAKATKAELEAMLPQADTITAKVVCVFRDKYTGEVHAVGDTIAVTKERFDEINTVKTFVE